MQRLYEVPYKTPMPKRILILAAVVALAGIVFWIAQAQTAEPIQASSPDTDTLRTVAVTFDDLPGVVPGGLEPLTRVTNQLLDHITANNIPAIGFVNEVKLERPGEEAARTALLKQWIDAGLELGNHSYAHRSFHTTPLDTYMADVLRGEVVTRRLLAERGMTPCYYRHPYLRTGQVMEDKKAFERFLAEHGYTIAPVTIDNDEWIYAAAYNRAQGDSAALKRIGTAYVRYMDAVFAFYEQLSKDLLGYEVRHILLVHANSLNGDYFGEIAAMMKRRGYTFVPLEEALRDDAYRRGDSYTGPSGLSWLQRWLVAEGEKRRKEPSVDQFVRDMTGF